jgi:hypothetical protein
MLDAAAAAAHFEERERQRERSTKSLLLKVVFSFAARAMLSLDIMERKSGLMSFCRHNQRARFEEYIFTQKWTKTWPG